MDKNSIKTQSRERRHARVRARLSGTAVRPRLSVYKSNRYMHAQIIDDEAGKTLISGTTRSLKASPVKGQKPHGARKMEAAIALGSELAKKAKAAGIASVVFDRGGFRYTGRVAAIAEAVRKGGVQM
jgi:large subunit ribosomal protein L18